MRLIVFSVRDLKAEMFSRPFFSKAPGEAIRSFSMECENPESMLHRYPDDYQLYRVGEFNELTGELVYTGPSAPVCGARDFVPAVIPQLVKEVG